MLFMLKMSENKHKYFSEVGEERKLKVGKYDMLC